MAFKRYSISVAIHLALIIILTFSSGIIFDAKHDLHITLFLVFVLAVLVISLVYTIHRVVRDTSFFFEAIMNEDGSLHFPEETGSKGLNVLHKNLNQLGKIVEEIRLESTVREKYYQALIQHSATGLIALNALNEVEIINEKAAEYAGIPPETYPAMIKSKNNELCNLLISIQPGETLAYRVHRNSSLLHLSLKATEIIVNEDHYKLISLQDIRQELNEKELESWQKLIRVLTHEIMNSIAPITSLTASLRKYFRIGNAPRPPSDISPTIIENTIHGLETIEERGSGLLRFVDSYRRLYKIPPPVYKTFQVEEWLNNLKMLFSDKFRENQIQFEITCLHIKEISADETLLSHVIINILNNAIDALNEGEGPRTIKIQVEEFEKARTRISVSNNGPVIPPDILDKIFIPFFTTKESGSGIGLSLSRQIIYLHGGYMDVSSNAEATNFVIVI
jgi:two-component system, NtrC family, nitrogen regulation sensor histidine kinase NtrY